MASAAELQQEITGHLRSKSLTVSSTWIAEYIAGIRSNTPLNALKQTALFRILASDFRQSLQPTEASTFPPNIANPSIKECTLSGPIPVQVLDIDDIGRSRWSQVEEIEARERGETTKGREIIRVLPSEDGSTQAEQPRSFGPHKVLLQDANGSSIYAVELVDVDGIDLSMNIGTKLVLRNVTVARGVVLLEPSGVQVLGGKIDSLHKAWQANRKQTLRSLAGALDQDTQ